MKEGEGKMLVQVKNEAPLTSLGRVEGEDPQLAQSVEHKEDNGKKTRAEYKRSTSLEVGVDEG